MLRLSGRAAASLFANRSSLQNSIHLIGKNESRTFYGGPKLRHIVREFRYTFEWVAAAGFR